MEVCNGQCSTQMYDSNFRKMRNGSAVGIKKQSYVDSNNGETECLLFRPELYLSTPGGGGLPGVGWKI